MALYDTYPFTNISKEKFIGRYEKETYEFEPGETKFLPSFLVNGFTNQFVGWATNTKEFGYEKKDGTFDKPRFLSDRKASIIEQLTDQKYKIVRDVAEKKEATKVVAPKKNEATEEK